MFTIKIMHPTTRRLYAALEEMLGLESVGSTQAAKALGLASAQTINNWEERGVSKSGMVRASSACGIRTAWLERNELPMFEAYQQPASSGPLRAEEPTPSYAPNVSVIAALSALEKSLSELNMAGRERLAPLFESFARAPGPVIKQDIADLLVHAARSKSHQIDFAAAQKAG